MRFPCTLQDAGEEGAKNIEDVTTLIDEVSKGLRAKINVRPEVKVDVPSGDE